MIRKRRTPPRTYADYRKYRKWLREDFACQCGYCTIHESEWGGPDYFTIDHFKPRSKFPLLQADYNNLLYSCNECNRYKGDDWPSDDPLTTGKGYLDPCKHDYDQHFRIHKSGTIEGLSAPARYMIEHLWLNRQFLVEVRLRRAQDNETLTLYEQILKRLSKLLEDTKDKAVEEELKVLLEVSRQAYQLVKSRVAERAQCRPLPYWRYHMRHGHSPHSNLACQQL